MTLSNDDKKHLRGIGHKLNPVVTIASKGLTDSVAAELDRALDDHELIKVRLSVGDRDAKKVTIDETCKRLKAELVQTIGHVILLHRKAAKPNPKLSNLLRPQQ
ncbi:MAG: YhbY family RNA-binding protein [Gammaproteobacteria bacterium]|nr:YhbY family RNA-binding protein [Gammaproteobacteria bacterium]MBQ0840002.1 YhbY family RNA-binding protein [Gammaproteobacteria bacterium]